MPQLTKNRRRKGRREEGEAGRKAGERERGRRHLERERGREGDATYVALAAGTHFTIKFSTLPKLLLTQEAVCAGVTSDT